MEQKREFSRQLHISHERQFNEGKLNLAKARLEFDIIQTGTCTDSTLVFDVIPTMTNIFPVVNGILCLREYWNFYSSMNTPLARSAIFHFVYLSLISML